MISYKKGSGFLYRLNPLIKGLLAAAVILLFSFLRSGPQPMAVLLAVVLVSAFLSRVPLKDIFYSMGRIFVLLALVAVVQGFSGGTFDYLAAVEAVLRVMGIFISAGIYVTVSSQSELTFFCETCFKPLGLLGIPVRELALVMVIAVRFFPVIFGEIERIRISQIARGAELKNKSLIASAGALMPLLVPTLTQSILRAGELAQAMEARGYNSSANRTRYRQYKISVLDVFTVLLPVVALLLWALH